jgi:hypothetical protein
MDKKSVANHVGEFQNYQYCAININYLFASVHIIAIEYCCKCTKYQQVH